MTEALPADERRRILFATTNPGKLREARQILAGFPIALASLADFPSLSEPVEDQPTFEGNARLKAIYYASSTGVWTIADDSGLEVDALDGAPGVLSARYAGVGASDTANNAKLIRALAGVPGSRRSARFRCVVALATPRGVLAVAEGTIEGRIIDEPRGANGFGYDPHFFVPEFELTTAQMPPEQKNELSHRGRALAALKVTLARILVRPSHQADAPDLPAREKLL